jgi:maltose alpha-D-glucosyltransferase/alpha-amylase
MVTDAERDYLWSTYAADPRARINLGIRRRLAPLMDNDRRKIELMNSILMSMPGTPIIYYGDEIGMGDNIYLGDRNGGFSRADPARLYLPPIMDPVYGYAAINVEAQTRSLSSLLSWTKRLIGVRKSSQVFGRGTLTLVRPANRTVLAYVRQLGDEAILCVANLSRSAQAVELDLSAWKGRIPQEMLGRSRFPRIGELPYLVTLPPYGFYWFELHSEPKAWQERALPREVTTLVLGSEGLDSLVTGRNRRTLELDVLPSFIAERRWFGDKGSRRVSVDLPIAFPLNHGPDHFLLSVADVTSDGATSRYQLPLTIRWQRYTEIENETKVIAALRRTAREGSLVDAATEPEFAAMLVAKVHAGETATNSDRQLSFRRTTAFDTLHEVKSIKVIGAEQSNTSVIAESKYVVKLLRKVTPGIHPEIEIGRFFVEHAPFANAPRLLGSVELIENGQGSALAAIHEFIENQGDAWSFISQSLDRLIAEQQLLPSEAINETPEIAAMIGRLRQIGERTADFHRAIASRPDIPDFAPEPIGADDMARWTDAQLERARNVFRLLDLNKDSMGDAAKSVAAAIVKHREQILAHIDGNRALAIDAMKIRHHGDFHLGQVLIANNDSFLLDFEGEPRRSLDERRHKAPAARDVAGFCRSIDYATSAALDRAAAAPGETKSDLAMRLRLWTQKLIEAYWKSYRAALSDDRLWPGDEEQSRQLLDLFLLEKAFYEIEYELTNRPDWVGIPLDATLRILRQRGVVPS